MTLKKLKIKGFKSFADAVELQFSDGISAIVGPNGSGKSNITDAIRWVLGEQSTRILRGKKMEDVIFAGTAEKSPLGYAEVVLILDNADRQLPEYPEEIHITRRLFRSGESEYLLNKKNCRLKDIQQIFTDTGLGKNGYSLISQGEIDEIVSSGPAELRCIVEEAVGIVSYKNRKLEAERKLLRTQDNMDRVLDILEELEKQREPLRRQAKKAKDYLAIYDELKTVDLYLFVTRIDELVEAHQEKSRQMMDVEAEINAITQALSVKDKAYQKNKEALGLLDEQLTESEQRGREIEEALSQLRGDILVGREHLRHLEENHARLSTQIKEIDQLLQDHEQKIADALKNCDMLASELEQLAEKINDAEAEKKELLIQVDALKSDSSALREKNDELLLRQETLSRKLVETKEKNASEQTKLAIAKESVAALESEQTAEQQHLEALIKEAALEEQNRTQFSRTLSDLREREKQIEKDCLRMTQTIALLENNIQVSLSKRDYLKSVQEHYSDYFPSIQAIMTSGFLDGSDQNQIFGPVGELLEVPAEYTKAIEVVLGSRTQHIVVQTLAVAGRCIEQLKRKKIGRATFLPLDNLRYQKADLRDQALLSKMTGYIGFASTLVRCDQRFRAVTESLLGRVIVAKDFNAAKEIRKRFRQYTLVTLEGELFQAGGAVVGGAGKTTRQSPLTKKTEIERLNTEINEMRREKADTEKQFSERGNALKTIKAQILDSEAQLRKTEQHLWQTEQEMASCRNNSESIEKRLAELRKELTDAETAMAEAFRQIEKSETGLSELKEMMAEETDEQKVGTLLETIAEIDQHLSEFRVRQAEKNERKHQFEEQIKRLEERITEDIVRKEKLLSELSLSETEANDQRERLTEWQEEESLQKKQREENLASRALMVQEQREKSRYTDEINREIQRLNHEMVLQNNAKNNFELQISRTESEKAHLEENTYARYEMNYLMAKDALKDSDPNMLDLSSERQRSLRSKLNAIGHVNPSAIEEYAVLNERYTFLKTQFDDLNDAKKDLETVIDTLYHSMAKQFSQGFARLQEIFTRVFRILFKGGTAHLRLTDPEHVMESGIELTAQPPGKNLNHLSLLSGGETAMTAIALLFSFLELNPSPFCVIDEIDAALDESNIRRFMTYMTNMAEKIQFMIITHRNQTLEACDTVYGVSMSKSGISKLVSVRLSDYETAE